MDGFKLGQLTKELVAAKLRAMDDPCVAAAGIVRAALAVALPCIPEDGPERAAAIQQACQGGMTGLLLAEQSTTRGAVLILTQVAEVASDCHMDPTAAMESALRGITDLHRFILPDRLEELRAAVDAAFLGAGDVLRKLFEQAKREERLAAS